MNLDEFDGSEDDPWSMNAPNVEGFATCAGNEEGADFEKHQVKILRLECQCPALQLLQEQTYAHEGKISLHELSKCASLPGKLNTSDFDAR